MTKHEIYEALKNDGAKLSKAERFMSLAELKDLYAERFGKDVTITQEPAKEPAKPAAKDEICLLRFSEAGWCEALHRSYSRGLYRPKNKFEFNALLPFAAEVVKP